MNRNILRYNLLIAMALLLCTCDETIVRPDCDERNDISLKIAADYFTECSPDEILPAAGTSFRIISGGDTIASGNLDGKGQFDTGPIENTGCGLNNVVIEASYNGKSIRETFGLLCCDTLLRYRFPNIPCEPPLAIECESIDTTIVKIITSSGNCVLQNAAFDDLKNNSVIIASETPLRIELNQLLSLTGKIYVDNISPEPADSQVTIDGNQLEIYFNVDRSSLDTIAPVTIQLPVFCLDSLGSDVNSGTITIVVSATVCDPNNCYCPFDAATGSDIFYADENVTVGNNQSFNFMLYSLSEGNFGDGCVLRIDSITRDDGTNAYLNGSNSWTIANQPIPDLSVGDEFAVNANFAPTQTGEITEGFIAFASVYSELDLNNPNDIGGCELHFKLRGNGCDDNSCPLIQVLGFNVKRIDRIDHSESSIIIGTKVDPNEGDIILQKLTAQMGTDCLNEMEEPAAAAYNIILPNGYYCSDMKLSVHENVLGAYDDRNRFNPVLTHSTLSTDQKNSGLAIYFDPPDLVDHYNSNHDSIYQCSFMLEIADEEGNLICSQEIRVIAEVYEFSLSMGDVIPMQAFSQISVQDNNPSYHVYDVDEYNKTLGNYGLRESLTRSFVNFTSTPNTPKSSHTLYFDVDSPDNPAVNFTQQPKLYLINSFENSFSKVSSAPVATYPTPNAFFSNYENGNLMDQIFSNPGVDRDNFNWEPNRGKGEFSLLGGVDIHPFEVYVIWDPSSTPNVYNFGNGQERINCGMALIYISSVKTGQDNTDVVTGGNGKASVSFYVVYPVKY
jgi:hypothetical protein